MKKTPAPLVFTLGIILAMISASSQSGEIFELLRKGDVPAAPGAGIFLSPHRTQFMAASF